MARPVTLFSGQWADLPFAEIVELAAEMGFDGLELPCWGDHFDVNAAVDDSAYCDGRHEILAASGLKC
jgi:sugar phosphate isomerase/epimerase